MKKCKRCRLKKIEDDAHILAACPHNKNLITKQHDYVVKKLTKELMNSHQEARIWREIMEDWYKIAATRRYHGQR